MKSIKIILLYGIGIIVSLMLLYGLIKFIIIPYWEPILFYIFILCAISYMLLVLITLIRINKVNPFSKDFVWDSFSEQLHKANKIIYIRNIITKILAPFFYISHWASFAIIGFLIRNKLNPSKGKYSLIASASIDSPEHYHSITTFILILFTVFIITISNLDYEYHKYILILLIVGILSKELFYAFSIQSLPQKLKRSLGNPYLRFILILTFDFLSLSLSFTFLQIITNHVQFSFQLYFEIINGLFRLQKIQELMKIGSLSIGDWFISIGGLIFYFSLFKAMLSYKEFKRKDSDIIGIAAKYLQAGDFYLCQKWLSKVKEITADKLLYECACYMGLNQIEKAFQFAEKRIKMDSENPTVDEVYTQIYGMLLYAPVPLEFIENIISYSIKHKVSDARITASLIFIVLSNELLFEDTSLFSKIDFRNEGYLLSHSFILINSFENAEALVLLEAMTSNSPFEELLRIFLIQYIVIFSVYNNKEEEINAYKKWLEDNYETIINSVKNLKDDWEKITISSFIRESSLLCGSFIPYREQEFKYLADTLLQNIDEHKYPKIVIDTILSMTSQMDKKLKDTNV